MSAIGQLLLKAMPKSWLREIVARYEGATNSTDRSWLFTALQSARFDVNASTRQKLQAKAIYFEANNDLLNRMADVYEQYVVGPSLKLTPSSSEADYNAAASEFWDKFAAYPDETTLQPFGTIMSLGARMQFVQGEVFIKKSVSRDSRMPRIELIEGHRCSTPPEYYSNSNFIDGIEVNGRGRPVRYWFRDAAEPKWIPVPANEIIHWFEQSRPDQYRGIPDCSCVINALHDRDDLEMLEMRKAKINASKSNVIKKNGGSLSATDLRRQQFSKSVTLNTGNTASESRVDHWKDVVGGDWIVLDTNEEFSEHKSDSPTATTQQFWRYLAEKICTGTGIPYVLVNPDSMQGTVYRGSIDMASQYFRSRFEIAASVASRIYEFVMYQGQFVDPRLAAQPEDYWRVSISPPRSISADVGYNAQAVDTALKNGTMSLLRHYAERGLDWKEELQQIAAERAVMSELGLNFETVASAVNEQQQTGGTNAQTP